MSEACQHRHSEIGTCSRTGICICSQHYDMPTLNEACARSVLPRFAGLENSWMVTAENSPRGKAFIYLLLRQSDSVPGPEHGGHSVVLQPECHGRAFMQLEQLERRMLLHSCPFRFRILLTDWRCWVPLLSRCCGRQRRRPASSVCSVLHCLHKALTLERHPPPLTYPQSRPSQALIEHRCPCLLPGTECAVRPSPACPCSRASSLCATACSTQ
jgi:hypothetical protein